MIAIERITQRTLVELQEYHARHPQRHDSAVTVTAYANHGRWVAECPACGAGIALLYGTPALCCGLDCGAVYASVTWPAQRLAIEVALDERARDENKNWLPGQTVADLRRERDVHEKKERN